MQQSHRVCLALCGAMALFARAERDTPVSKVISLLGELKAEVEAEGKKEATSYNDFACFCKKTTGGKSSSITLGKDRIDILSANIEKQTALKGTKSSELKERQATQEEQKQDLAKTTVQCAKDKAEYDATAADLSKAISSLQSAITAMEDTKPVALLALRHSLVKSLALAEALNLTAGKNRSDAQALLQQAAQVDPLDPEYRYHSQGIVDTLTKLLKEFTDQKAEVDAEWSKTLATCTSKKKSLNQLITENDVAMSLLEGEIQSLTVQIAGSRASLVNSEAVLQDDQLYLKDLTERCEARAKDWDQRSQLRAGELGALSGALAILTQTVSSLDTEVNQRAMLLERGVHNVGRNVSHDAKGNASAQSAPAVGRLVRRESPAKNSAPLSFLQGMSAEVRSHGFLAREALGSSLQARQDAVAGLLREESKRLGSTPLSMLASRLAADPFTKVKTLIQQLIERLLKEATNEATKKGYCDEELGKARKDREYRFQDAQSLNVELMNLEVKHDELESEIATLTADLMGLRDTLNASTVNRKTEKESNEETIMGAKEGLTAITQALAILKDFYKQAAKATVLAQASPVDEDTDGAGFTGAYTGKQEASRGVIGMIEVIQTDFERTIRVTEAAEAEAHASFVKFERVSKADISGKETKKTLDEEDLDVTKSTISQKMDDLKTTTALLDSALKVIEGLKPTCIDHGMSYKERVEKREEEIAALKKALCILDEDKKEPLCQ